MTPDSLTNRSRFLRTVTPAATVLLCAVPLLWRLDYPSFWVDEQLTLQMIQGDWSQVISACSRDLHPPFYFLTLKAWSMAVGQGDATLRLFSVLCSLVSVLFMFRLVGRVLGGGVAAVTAALLLGLHPAFIEFGRMARYYPLVLMLGLLSQNLLMDAVESDRSKTWILYGCCGGLMLYTFYPAGVLLVAQGVFYVVPLRHARLLKRWLAGLTLAGLVFLPWFVRAAAEQIAAVSAGAGADLSASLHGYVAAVAVSLYTFGVGQTLFPWRPQAILGLLAVVAILVIGMRGVGRSAVWKALGVAVMCLLLVSVITTFVSVGTPFVNVPVRTLFALPCFMLAVTAGWATVRARLLRAGLGLALALAWVSGTSNYFASRDAINPIYFTPSREAAQRVASRVAGDDLVISEEDSVFAHYFLRMTPTTRHSFADPLDAVESTIRQWHPPHLWLVTIGRDQTRRDSRTEDLRREILRAYRLDASEGLLPIDPVYRRLKEKWLGRACYTHRLTIERFVRSSQGEQRNR